MADLRWANNKTTKMFTFIHSCLEREDIIVEAYLQAGFNRVRSIFQSLDFELRKSSKIGLSRQKNVTCLSRPIVFQVKKTDGYINILDTHWLFTLIGNNLVSLVTNLQLSYTCYGSITEKNFRDFMTRAVISF